MTPIVQHQFLVIVLSPVYILSNVQAKRYLQEGWPWGDFAIEVVSEALSWIQSAQNSWQISSTSTSPIDFIICFCCNTSSFAYISLACEAEERHLISSYFARNTLEPAPHRMKQSKHIPNSNNLAFSQTSSNVCISFPFIHITPIAIINSSN
jgi:hypothetical protein